MKIEVVEQEKVKKKEVAKGAGALILIGLIAFFFLYKPHKCPYCDEAFRTKAELIAHIEAKHPGEPIPDEDQGQGAPEVKVIGLGFEGSPQAPTITKFQGDDFTAFIAIENEGGAGILPFELGIGSHTIWHDDFGNSPWTASFDCPPGKSTLKMTCTLSKDFPAQPDNPFDAWVIVHGKHYDFHDCFTVRGLAAAITVLSISWL
ncbi:hypothetical protein ES708_25748 [subsurface metagenome]|jgi:hypothetical protein